MRQTGEQEAVDVDSQATVFEDEPSGDELYLPVGSSIGRYVVVAPLGKGGMGLVVRAYDAKLHREVAIKMLRMPGDDESHVRMIREAQAMARLSHPNIVAVYDADTWEGHPYIAMEYVQGATLRAWLGERSHPWRDVVATFIAAGRGLAAAHDAGLVHRDFKPANVMRGEDGRIQVTDFGIALAVDDKEVSSSPDPERSVERLSTPHLTDEGVAMGTPAYMSPEQHHGRPADGKSDQYAFCIALWEGLSGRRPFAGPMIERAKWERRLREPEDGRGPPRHLRPVLLRGLSPDPHDRYDSMNALLVALDRDPSRRRRGLAVAGVAAASIAGWGVAAWHQRTDATEACRAAGQSIQAVWNAEAGGQVRRGLLASGASFASGAADKAITRLDRYAAAWTTLRRDHCVEAVDLDAGPPDPRVVECLEEQRAEVQALVALLSEADLGVAQAAVRAVARLPPVDRCIDETWLAQRTRQPEDQAARAEVSELRRSLREVEAKAATGRYQDALATAEAVVERAEALGWPPLRAEAQLSLGSVLRRLGRYDDAVAALRDAFLTAVGVGHDATGLAAAVSLIGVTGVQQARTETGWRWHELAKMLARRLALADDHPLIASMTSASATLHGTAGNFDASLRAHQRALEVWEQTAGADHPLVAAELNGVGAMELQRGRLDPALEAFQRALVMQERTLGEDHPTIATSLNNIAVVQERRGDYRGALRALQRALEIWEAAFGEDHPSVAFVLGNIGLLHDQLGDGEAALAALERSLAASRRLFGEDHPEVAAAHNGLGVVHERLEDLGAAKSAHEQALRIRLETLAPDHPDVALSLSNLAAVLEKLGDTHEALDAYERALEIRRKVYGNDNAEVARALISVGRVQLALGRAETAVTTTERGLAILGDSRDDAKLQATGRFVLARAVVASGGDPKDANALVEQARAALVALGDAGRDGVADIDQWRAELEHPAG